jgi:hypothetical protein
MPIEVPDFKVSLREGPIEVRDYPALVAAEVTVHGNRTDAAAAGFRLLAGYIFGGNTSRQSIDIATLVSQGRGAGEKISMTAPVSQKAISDAWTISFVMPSAYTLDTLPLPIDQRVHLTKVPPSQVAVVRFSGLAREPDIQRKSRELKNFIVTRRLLPVGTASVARHNPPWTPGFMRRHEIMIPLRVSSA